MTADTTPRRITGPLRTWYDLHEALGHEARALADLAPTLTPDAPEAFDAFDERLGRFRTSSPGSPQR